MTGISSIIMKNILILSTDRTVVHSLAEAFSLEDRVNHALDFVPGVIAHNQQPFDYIIVDMALVDTTLGAKEIQRIIKPFTAANPQVQFIAMAPREQIRRVVKAVKEWSDDYITIPVDPGEIQLVIHETNQAMVKELELDYLRDQFWKTEWLDVVHSCNTNMKKVYESIQSVAPTIATVLLLGETGTGKGLFSRLIHWHSLRSENPFIAVYCGAIPDTLLESELFGHEKGAFTGADRRKPGKFELARGGTIFLDEIGTITHAAQIKLLQVLQDGTFSRVGGEQLMTADVRIIAATNADLALMVNQGKFRKDLYYRLNIFPIELPSLKDRLEDLPYLMDVLLAKLKAKYGKKISRVHPAVYEGFQDYDWPGNIRELENLLERAYILETGSVLTPENFPRELVMNSWNPHVPMCDDGDISLADARHRVIHDFEHTYIKNLLKQTGGKINQAAKKA
ncbi:MAG TPA: sigma-54 dependent transcriptional regulator, partial [Desulfobacter sp.]|nr:sigma-54 dependent transcriptional regulator [Desulfobacter sp.]